MTLVKFSSVITLPSTRSADPASAGIERFVGLEHIEPENLHIRSWGLVADGTTFTNTFQRGQVLFGKRRAYQRKVAVAEFDGVCSSDIYVFESKDPTVLLPELLPFILQSEGFYEYAVKTSAGSLSPRTNWKQLAEYEFPLPPVDEQRRIADLLWAADDERDSFRILFDDLCKLEASLKLSIFSTNHHKIKLGSLIESGKLSLKTGPFGTVLKASSYVKAGIPVVNPVNMVDGKFYVDEGPFINDQEAKRLQEYKIFENDLIFGRKGDIGRGIFATKENEGFIVGSDCIRVRVLAESVVPKYLFYFLTSPNSKRLLGAQSHGTTMPGINEKMLSRMEVYIPDHSEQLEIISKLEQVDESKAQIQDRISKSMDLKKTLLQKFLR